MTETTHTSKELLELFPEDQGWSHVSMQTVSAMGKDTERRLAALMLSGVSSTPVEMGYSWSEGDRLVMVFRRAQS